MDGDQRMYFDTSVKGSLEDLLDDPLIRLLMDSDEVSVQALITLIEPVQLALSSRTREGGCCSPGGEDTPTGARSELSCVNLLDDPLIRQVMESDGVSYRAMTAIIEGGRLAASSQDRVCQPPPTAAETGKT